MFNSFENCGFYPLFGAFYAYHFGLPLTKAMPYVGVEKWPSFTTVLEEDRHFPIKTIISWNGDTMVWPYRLRPEFEYLKKYNWEEKVMWFLAHEQPIVVSIHATNAFEYLRPMEVYRPPAQSCNHAVVLTGYGITEDGVKFYDFLNSGGRSFADGGYGKILRCPESIKDPFVLKI